ncbi:hypothetical protein [Salicibibacter kimchii]
MSIDKKTLLELKEKLSKGLSPQWTLADREMYDLEISRFLDVHGNF